MKISWNHLQSFFVDKLDKNLVLDRLTMAGLEVEDEKSVAPDFSGIVVGEVVECERHPDADKLSLCKIDAGTGELLQIICGAPNVKKGVKAPCAKVGAVLPGDFKIAERKMRGLVSYGMMCGGSEIGLDDGVDGLLLLAHDAPVGVDIREYLDLNDTIVEFKITPNRGDCLSYAGLVREIVALTDYKPNEAIKSRDSLENKSSDFKLNVSANQDCLHYVGLIIDNVNNNLASPNWLVKILERSGIRSISPIVDITNYVMLTLGQPMHAFDKDKLNNGIGVRLARDGEKIKLLDSKDATLSSNTLIITDGGDAPVAIAGVMGGLDSGVTEFTNSIVLESAHFIPSIVQGKSKQYGVSSDSSFRFERGVDSELQHDAINMAANLVIDICGGKIAEYVHFADLPERNEAIKLTFSEIHRFIGEEISENQIISILTKLGCSLSLDDGSIVVSTPSYRFDLKIKQDIIEEIIRVYGYDRIEAKMPHLEHSFDYLDKNLDKLNTLKNIMLGFGFNEIVSYAFIEDKYAQLFADGVSNPVKLQNPIAGLNVMRTNLLAGLVKTLQSNVNRGHDSVRIFELARVFHSENASEQPLYLSGLIYGKISPLNWLEKPRNVDFYDLRVVIEELLSGYSSFSLDASDILSAYHPGRSARIVIDGINVGYIGQLHPSYSNKLDLDVLPYVFEINVDLLSRNQVLEINIPSKYQKVSRDLAFVFNINTEIGTFIDAISKLKIKDLIDISLFDIFSGGNLASNEKSVAINFVFQSNHTLSDEEVNEHLDSIKNLALSEFSAKLR